MAVTTSKSTNSPLLSTSICNILDSEAPDLRHTPTISHVVRTGLDLRPSTYSMRSRLGPEASLQDLITGSYGFSLSSLITVCTEMLTTCGKHLSVSSVSTKRPDWVLCLTGYGYHTDRMGTPLLAVVLRASPWLYHN